MSPSPRELAVLRSCALIEAQQQLLGAFLGQQIVEHPPATRALMVGPHPDDNLLGPGGVALKYVAASIPVHWICLTDGRACVSSREERERMARLRPEEERECGRLVGVEDVELTALPEDRLTEAEVSDQAVRALRQALDRVRPDALFVPWWLETHPLHRYTAHLCARALEGRDEALTVYSWCLGSIAPPEMLVDVTAIFDRKCELMQAHASQLALHDYLGELRALHQVLGGHALQRIELAELYVPRDRASYVREVLALGLDDPRSLATGPQPMKELEEGS